MPRPRAGRYGLQVADDVSVSRGTVDAVLVCATWPRWVVGFALPFMLIEDAVEFVTGSRRRAIEDETWNRNVLAVQKKLDVLEVLVRQAEYLAVAVAMVVGRRL